MSGSGRVFAAEAIDGNIYAHESEYPVPLMHPTEDMLASRYMTVRGDTNMTDLDAVARVGVLTGRELNTAYIYAATLCVKTDECPTKTYDMLFDDIMRYPNYREMESIKKAVIFYCLCLFEEMQDTYCKGDNGARIITHEQIEKDVLTTFVEQGLKPLKERFSRCEETPHVFVASVLELIEDGGVLGYVQRFCH